MRQLIGIVKVFIACLVALILMVGCGDNDTSFSQGLAATNSDNIVTDEPNGEQGDLIDRVGQEEILLVDDDNDYDGDDDDNDEDDDDDSDDEGDDKDDDYELDVDDIDDDLEQAASCGHEHQDHKMMVCHHPPGNIDNKHEICIAKAALKAHVGRHGVEGARTYLGKCLD